MSKSPTSETGTTKASTLKDETSIKFKPSPNFKHMKKYLKSKFEEDMNSTCSPVTSVWNDQKKFEQQKVNDAVQPPLPPNSPPPDSPLSFTLKKEIEDDDYETSNGDQREDLQQEEFTLTPQGEQVEGTEKKKTIMCKDFFRKKCTRGTACIYAHEIDISQLKGIYKFCRDFENQRCNRPVCYFVHATTFEKEHFFRTAYLPPHTLSHLKTNGTPESNGNGPSDISTFNNPPPQPQVSAGAAPVSTALPPAIAESCAAAPGVPAIPSVTSGALKREWRGNEDFSSSPRDLDSSDPLAKKCKRCDLTEIRLQHNKTQLAQALRDSQELDEKIELMVKKNNRLHNVLKMLLKPRRVLEHVHNNLLTPSRLSVLGEERNKDALLSQMKVLLTKILLSSGENVSPEGDSRT